jgi:hypothetical protein
MPWTLESASAVVIARRFNVTAARHHWLVRQGIIGENDLLDGSLFSDAVVQVRTNRFQLLLLPDQLQFVPAVPPEEEQDVLVEKLGRLVGTLPHVPYKGMGLNFFWHLTPEDGDVNRVTRELFFVPDSALFRSFCGADARFGGYLSKDHGEFRLKLDVKPMVAQTDGSELHRVQFAFNFHRDVGEDDGADDILRHLQQWNELKSESERIIRTLEGGPQP